MLINVQLCQRTDINLKLTLFWKGITQFVIKPVNAFDDQDIIFSKLVSSVFPASGLEIKCRKIHSFSRKEIQHVFIKLLRVNSFQTLIILFSEFIQRRMFTIHKIVIHSNRMRLQAMSRKLNR